MKKANAEYNRSRLRNVNGPHLRESGEYVLYWMQLYRRFDYNHALEAAVDLAVQTGKPLVVYEGLKLSYPWASERLHRFILEGMLDNRVQAEKLGLNYWPFVETPDDPGQGLLRKLAKRAVAVVTDDFPCFIVPGQIAALASKSETPVFAVDGNSLVPLSRLGEPVHMAAHLRPRIHKNFVEAWEHRLGRRRSWPDVVHRQVAAPFETWKGSNLEAFLAKLPLDRTVPAVTTVRGGSTEAKKGLRMFLSRRLAGYAEERSAPTSPQEGHASGLSPYLHFGHISIEEIVEKVLASADWTPGCIDRAQQGKRAGFFGVGADIDSFLDEAITWRDVGLQWHWTRRDDTASLERALPKWAWASLQKHANDSREFVYTLDEWERGQTHDPLWNAAQRELVATGTIQNYLRMLWGKKVIEWSESPEDAYRTLVHLNNKYALDGRNPNSYTGILWCFGLFDRPWAPERKVFGSIRYMSSENTAKKFRLAGYYEYVEKFAATR